MSKYMLKALGILLVALFVISVTVTAIDAKHSKAATKTTVVGQNATGTKTTVVGTNAMGTKATVVGTNATGTKATVVGTNATGTKTTLVKK